MRKYRNTKIVKSILLGLPVLFCSCYNNDSIKNGHCEDERNYFRFENGVVKIYNQPGTYGTLLKTVTVNEELSTKLNAILTYFNDVLKNYPKKAQQFILNNFDTTKVYNELFDLFVEFYDTHVRYVEQWVKELVVSKEQLCNLVRSYGFNMVSEGWKKIKQESIENEHFENEKNFRREDGVVKIYDKPGKDGTLLKTVTVNEELSTKLNAILTYFNDTLKNYLEEEQQFILNNFDTTNGFNTLQDLFIEFCLAHVRYLEKWVKELVSSKEKQCSFVRLSCFYMISEGWKNIKQETSVFMPIP